MNPAELEAHIEARIEQGIQARLDQAVQNRVQVLMQDWNVHADTMLQNMNAQVLRMQQVAAPATKVVARLCKPVPFQGTQDVLIVRRWLSSVKEFVSDGGISEEEKVKTAASYMQGRARDWWLSLDTRGLKPKTFKEFEDAVKKKFFPLDYERKILKELENLKQDGSVAAYAERFEDLRSQTTITEEFARYFFCKGLTGQASYEIGMVLLHNPSKPLTELYQEAAAVGNLAEARAKTSGPTAMELDAIRVVRSKTRGNSKQMGSRGGGRQECFKCGQAGHFKRDCPAIVSRNSKSGRE